MLSKFEVIGVLGSVALMSLALFLLRLDTSTLAKVSNDDTQSAAVIVVDEEKDTNQALAEALMQAANQNGVPQQLVIDDVTIGTGAEAVAGKKIKVHYVGRLSNGQEFDSSVKRGEPFTFTLGAGEVIKGWDQGIVGMKVGGSRTLVIPANLAYGDRAVGPIPANATLLFQVDLLDVQ